MKTFKKLARAEFDLEFYACVHAVMMVWLYGLVQWIWAEAVIDFGTITQMMFLGYGLAWVQRLVFWGGRVYRPWEYRLRVCLWNILPVGIMAAVGRIFQWFAQFPAGAVIFFYGFALLFYGIVWIVLQLFYREDTKQLNSLLARYQKESMEYSKDSDRSGWDDGRREGSDDDECD